VSRLAALVVRRRQDGPAPVADDGGPPGEDQGDEDQGDQAQGDHGLYELLPAWERRKADQIRRDVWLEDKLFGRDRTPYPSYIGLIEKPPPDDAKPKVGVCCSGGGIRSAAFNLGALQAFQAEREDRDGRKGWDGVKYLAAVSGGSYIAAAFSMVAKTKDPDPKKRNEDDSDPELFERADRQPFYHGSPEEQYLRNRSSYMAPGGIGRIRLVLRVALGLGINLAFIGAGLVLIAWLLAVLYRITDGQLDGPAQEAMAVATWTEGAPVVGFAGVGLLLGLASVGLLGPLPDHYQRACESLALWFIGLAALIALVTLGLPDLVELLRNQYGGSGEANISTGEARGGAGAAATGGFGALLLATLLELRAKLTSEGAKEAKAWYQKLAAPLRRAIAQVAIWLAGPLLLGAGLVLALVWLVGDTSIDLWQVAVPAGVFVVLWSIGDVTSWSLHPFYRRRLCTAFALKRVKTTCADPQDRGVARERKYDDLVTLSESGIKPGAGPVKTWPTLVVCAAANVSDPAATPPGRSVTSFTFSPVAMGGPLVGGVKTCDLEACVPPSRRRNFTLAAAVAMSGAAVSPSMGKETRASIRFLLALANVRLGVWVPNPRRAESWLVRPARWRSEPKTTLNRLMHGSDDGRTGQVSGAIGSDERRFRRSLLVPQATPWYLIKEMLGWNSVNDRYLYVTDGGHYENLGLVELLRRGCTEIFCFDASGGKRFDALGDAIALARSELGVEIDIHLDALEENDQRLARRCCARGTITYPGGAQGVLMYARTVVTRDVPYDIEAFRLRDPRFPHHSTIDQLYTDEKFEAYRELGAHAARAALRAAKRAKRAPAAASTNGAGTEAPEPVAG
jgi:hypothetical protein